MLHEVAEFVVAAPKISVDVATLPLALYVADPVIWKVVPLTSDDVLS